MSKPVLIIITGLPGTGKTTLGERLAQQYQLPFISKDALKNRMFDALGWSDKTWSLKVSAASHRIMDDFITQELGSQHSLIIESNFKVEIDSERFRKFQTQYACSIVQILCWAEGKVVFERFMARNGTAARHEGHVEAIAPEEIRAEFVAANGKDTPLDIDVTTIELDTTNLSKIDYTRVYTAIDTALA